MQKDILKYASLNALWTAFYVILVAIFLNSAGHIFGSEKTILIPIAMLLLFVFSASLCGALVLGRPVLWYMDGKKKEAITLFVYTLVVFFVVTLLAFLALYLVNY